MVYITLAIVFSPFWFPIAFVLLAKAIGAIAKLFTNN